MRRSRWPPLSLNAWELLRTALPCLDWLLTYDLKKNLKGDLVAGLSVGFMIIPQGMAYARVAGLPAIYGLYTGFVPCLVYRWVASLYEGAFVVSRMAVCWCSFRAALRLEWLAFDLFCHGVAKDFLDNCLMVSVCFNSCMSRSTCGSTFRCICSLALWQHLWQLPPAGAGPHLPRFPADQ